MTIQEIKKAARINLKENYLKCALVTLLYFIIVTILTYLLDIIGIKLENHTIILTIIQIIFGIVSLLLSYGIISNVTSISKGETKSVTSFINTSIKNAPKYILTLFNVFLRIIIPLLICLIFLYSTIVLSIGYLATVTNSLLYLAILCFALFLISLIVLIYFMLKYALVPYIYKSSPELSPKEIVQRSKELMKKQKSHYIFLMLSFSGWLLLTAIILFVLSYFLDAVYLTPIIILFYTLIKPYIIMSQLNFFEDLNNNEQT